uniref:HECT domain-containing protein n=1 Tax=Chromera velia CCMP2878 TaxID=1169474 RepID=A0A0G4FMN8_9ALVE|eukprot:Cvel_3526.t1-p1 / transcript=Cvel_3526.t1 / gene=Cvel_3526 / organism=Chromera_velia_CCMP2878 / gene_product=Ubiquitin-protein ligase E3A, putative / transcript_product=Ubiquitin-protein ligase E3A, putative / location=Cvel_scaffold143:81372-95780(+) / protein_length=1375 / sequence_SO=supercontig / SO=protein_coding / is_pseudo=false
MAQPQQGGGTAGDSHAHDAPPSLWRTTTQIDPSQRPAPGFGLGNRTLSLQSSGGSPLAGVSFKVFSWGANEAGQLLLGTSSSPSQGDVVMHGCEGEGASSSASAGVTVEEFRSAPACIQKLSGRRVRSVVAGLDSSWVVGEAGDVWGGGNNSQGQIDPQDKDAGSVVSRPRHVESLENFKVFAMAAGRDHAVAIQHNGNPLSFGVGEFGQLGTGQTSLRTEVPRQLKGFSGLSIRAVACGSVHSLILSTTGQVFVCGDNSSGALGVGDPSSDPSKAMAVTAVCVPKLFALPVQQVAAGPEHSLALTISGEVFAWGRNKDSRLGLGDEFEQKEKVFEPERVGGLPAVAKGIAAGGAHSLLILSKNKLMAAGSNRFGQLGIGKPGVPPFASNFRQVAFERGGKVRVASCGSNHSVVVTETGGLMAFGKNDLGQLGTGWTSESIGYPTPVAIFPQSAPLIFYSVSAGGDHSLAAALELDIPELSNSPQAAAAAASRIRLSPLPTQVNPPSDKEDKGAQSPFESGGSKSTRKALAASGGAGVGGGGGGGEDSSRLVFGLQRIPTGGTFTQLQGGMMNANFPVSASAAAAAAAALATGAGGGRSGGIKLEEEAQKGIVKELTRLETLNDRPMSSSSSAGIGASSRLPVPKSSPGIFSGSSGESASPSPGTGGDSDAGVVAVPLDRKGSCSLPLCLKPPPAMLPFVQGIGTDEVLSLLESQQREKEGLGTIAGPHTMRHRLSQVFESPLVLNASFLFPGRQAVLDSEGIEAFYRKVLSASDAAETAGVLLSSSLRCLETAAEGVRSLRAVDQIRFLIVILLCPLLGSDNSQSTAVMTSLAKLTFVLTEAGKRAFCKVICHDVPPSLFGARLVKHAREFCNRQILKRGERYREAVSFWHGIGLLQLLWQANEQTAGRTKVDEGGRKADPAVPLENFSLQSASALSPVQEVQSYHQLVVRKFGGACPPRGKLQSELFDVMKEHTTPPPEMTFLLAHINLCPLAFKRNCFMVEIKVSMQQGMLEAITSMTIPFFVLSVRRDRLLHDTMGLLLQAKPLELRRPLKVKFEGEEGIDEGGVKREFFSILIRELLNPNFGMFSYNEDTRIHWFNGNSLETKREFVLVGALLGLAIYNDVLLELSFPQAVYKKLQGEALDLSDLALVFPEESRSFQSLLQQPQGEEFDAAFGEMTFEVDYEFYGERRSQELCPGGAERKLTWESRQEYVRLYTKWLLEDSVKDQFEPFKEGFLRICGAPMLPLFSAEELQLLVCGEPQVDFKELRKGAQYEGGYSETHPFILGFWDTLEGFSLEQKLRFLHFCTGSSRVPVGGLKELNLKIQRNGPDTDRLPTAYTCFNALLLPEYSTKEKMKTVLLRAIEEAEGFGMQ